MKRIAADFAGEPPVPDERRGRILAAAFAIFMERGYSAASTREIAKRAKVSKRELYTLFGSKQGLIAELVTRRVQEMRRPLELTPAADLAGLEATLAAFGAHFLRQIVLPGSIALSRLAVIEAERTPELARTLVASGRDTLLAALAAFLSDAQSRGLVAAGDPSALAGQFFALLMGDLPMRLLLRVVEPPAEEDIDRHARAVTATWATLHASPRRRIGPSPPRRRSRG
jgi:AcrR family transcriptional regulator